MKNEPSMEQILASIRKIMAEEASAVSSQNFPKEGESSPSEGILELTQPLEEDPESSLNQGGEAQSVNQNFSPADSTPLSEIKRDVSSLEAQSVSNGMQNFAMPNTMAQDSFNAVSSEQASASFTEGDAGVNSLFPSSMDSLLSENAMRAGVSAIQGLRHASQRTKVSEEKKDSLKGRTVDDIMTELLKPLLSEWLNKNLPELVERVVKEEIRKIVEKA
jgi:hypothetical protein